MDLLDQLLKVTKDASMDFNSIVEDFMMEDAVASAELKAKHAAETEKLKDSQERDLESLTTRHEREVARQSDSDSKEKDDDAIKSKRDADRKSNEKQSEGLLNFIDTWKQELDEVSASKRLTTRLKKSGVDLDKRAKDRAKEHAALVKKYGKKNESFDLDEGKLVASVRDILKVITRKIETKLDQEYTKNPERGLGMINTLGAMVGHKVTDQKQDKGKMFLKFGEETVTEDRELDEDMNALFFAIWGTGAMVVLPALIMYQMISSPQTPKLHRDAKASTTATVGKLISKFKKDKNYKPTSAEIDVSKKLENEVKNKEPSIFKKAMSKLKSIKSKKEEVEESRYTDEKDKRQKATLKKHDKRMIKISRDSIKKYEKGRKEETEVEEDRDYKKERENYGGRPEQMERNAARKRARRQMEKEGKAKAGDGKDVHHKDNNPLNNDKNNLSLVSQNYNRKEPRLRMKKLKERGALPNVRK